MDWCDRRADTKLDASGFEPLQANRASRILYSNFIQLSIKQTSVDQLVNTNFYLNHINQF